MSENLQPLAVDYLKSCLVLDLDHEQQTMLTGLITQIQDAKFDSALWERSQTYNQMLNQIRNEDHLTLYKEQL